jgi:hypothetical protein
MCPKSLGLCLPVCVRVCACVCLCVPVCVCMARGVSAVSIRRPLLSASTDNAYPKSWPPLFFCVYSFSPAFPPSSVESSLWSAPAIRIHKGQTKDSLFHLPFCLLILLHTYIFIHTHTTPDTQCTTHALRGFTLLKKQGPSHPQVAHCIRAGGHHACAPDAKCRSAYNLSGLGTSQVKSGSWGRAALPKWP